MRRDDEAVVGPGAVPAVWAEYRGTWSGVQAEVIQEILLTLYVNGRETVNIMCSPRDQDFLALGLLKNEGLLGELTELQALTVSRNGCCVDVWLDHAVPPPRRVVITSGCGGGVTFDDPEVGVEPLVQQTTITPERLFQRFNELHLPDSLHARARGVHAAGLSDGEQILAMAEDVGRHNTIDKLCGMCLTYGIETRGRILLATGRVSSEMLRKGALMGCPIIASRNSPTSMSVAMAEAWNITLVGYVRQGSLRVYAHPERLGGDGSIPSPRHAGRKPRRGPRPSRRGSDA
jgi:FdhD protein